MASGMSIYEQQELTKLKQKLAELDCSSGGQSDDDDNSLNADDIFQKPSSSLFQSAAQFDLSDDETKSSTPSNSNLFQSANEFDLSCDSSKKSSRTFSECGYRSAEFFENSFQSITSSLGKRTPRSPLSPNSLHSHTAIQEGDEEDATDREEEKDAKLDGYSISRFKSVPIASIASFLSNTKILDDDSSPKDVTKYDLDDDKIVELGKNGKKENSISSANSTKTGVQSAQKRRKRVTQVSGLLDDHERNFEEKHDDDEDIVNFDFGDMRRSGVPSDVLISSLRRNEKSDSSLLDEKKGCFSQINPPGYLDDEEKDGKKHQSKANVPSSASSDLKTSDNNVNMIDNETEGSDNHESSGMCSEANKRIEKISLSSTVNEQIAVDSEKLGENSERDKLGSLACDEFSASDSYASPMRTSDAMLRLERISFISPGNFERLSFALPEHENIDPKRNLRLNQKAFRELLKEECDYTDEEIDDDADRFDGEQIEETLRVLQRQSTACSIHSSEQIRTEHCVRIPEHDNDCENAKDNTSESRKKIQLQLFENDTPTAFIDDGNIDSDDDDIDDDDGDIICPKQMEATLRELERQSLASSIHASEHFQTAHDVVHLPESNYDCESGMDSESEEKESPSYTEDTPTVSIDDDDDDCGIICPKQMEETLRELERQSIASSIHGSLHCLASDDARVSEYDCDGGSRKVTESEMEENLTCEKVKVTSTAYIHDDEEKDEDDDDDDDNDNDDDNNDSAIICPKQMEETLRELEQQSISSSLHALECFQTAHDRCLSDCDYDNSDLINEGTDKDPCGNQSEIFPPEIPTSYVHHTDNDDDDDEDDDSVIICPKQMEETLRELERQSIASSIHASELFLTSHDARITNTDVDYGIQKGSESDTEDSQSPMNGKIIPASKDLTAFSMHTSEHFKTAHNGNPHDFDKDQDGQGNDSYNESSFKSEEMDAAAEKFSTPRLPRFKVNLKSSAHRTLELDADEDYSMNFGDIDDSYSPTEASHNSSKVDAFLASLNSFSAYESARDFHHVDSDSSGHSSNALLEILEEEESDSSDSILPEREEQSIATNSDDSSVELAFMSPMKEVSNRKITSLTTASLPYLDYDDNAVNRDDSDSSSESSSSGSDGSSSGSKSSSGDGSLSFGNRSMSFGKNEIDRHDSVFDSNAILTLNDSMMSFSYMESPQRLVESKPPKITSRFELQGFPGLPIMEDDDEEEENDGLRPQHDTLELAPPPLDETTGYSLFKPIGNFLYNISIGLKKSSAANNLRMKDLKRLKILGEGQFGQVWLVADKDENAYALKLFAKYDIVQEGEVDMIVHEKEMHQRVHNHPFIVKLVSAFQDEFMIYMMQEFAQGGELFSIIQKYAELSESQPQGSFVGVPEDNAKFYTACIADAIAHMHGMQIAYRDLKPENVMIDSKGYPLVIDFGYAKHVPDRTYTFCGTPRFLPPEAIRAEETGYSYTLDHWSLGVLLYEMLAGGENPFYYEGMSELALFTAIEEEEYLPLPEDAFSAEAIDIVAGLLTKDPSQRLGSLERGESEILEHAWLNVMDMEALRDRKIQAPWVPEAKSALDTSCFDNWDDLEDKASQKYPRLPPRKEELFKSFPY